LELALGAGWPLAGIGASLIAGRLRWPPPLGDFDSPLPELDPLRLRSLPDAVPGPI